MAFSSDDQTLASGSEDQTVRLWGVDTGQSLNTLTGHTNGVLSVAWSPATANMNSPNGYLLASSSRDRTVLLWDVGESSGSGQSCITLLGHSIWVWSAAFSPDGQTLASGSDDQTIRL